MGVLFVILVAVIAVGCAAAWSEQSARFPLEAMTLVSIAGVVGWVLPV